MKDKKKSKTEKILSKVGKEMKEDEPEIVTKTRRNKGGDAAKAQKTAILLSKAREDGADIPPPKRKRRGPHFE